MAKDGIEANFGKVLTVAGLSDWGIWTLDALGRWQMVTELSRLAFFHFIFSPYIFPILVFLGMWLVQHATTREFQQALDDSRRPPLLHGIEATKPKMRSNWGLLWAVPIATIVSALTVFGWLWNYTPDAPPLPPAPPVDSLAYYDYPAPKISHPDAKAKPGIVQTATAPCSGNAIGGSVDNQNCGSPNPYRPVVTYDPNGMKRTISPGKVVGDDSLLAVTKAFDDDLRTQQWQLAISLADQTRQADPGWFTLDYVEGYGYAGICNTANARSYLQKFIDETKDAPSYSAFRGNAEQEIASFNDVNYLFRCSSRQQ